MQSGTVCRPGGRADVQPGKARVHTARSEWPAVIADIVDGRATTSNARRQHSSVVERAQPKLIKAASSSLPTQAPGDARATADAVPTCSGLHPQLDARTAVHAAN